MKNNRRMLFAVVMACLMLVGLLPMTAMADGVVYTENLPDTLTVDEGRDMKLSVTVEGEEHTYQWYTVNTVDPAKELPIENETNHEYHVDPVTKDLNGKQIYCRVDGAISKICTITVISIPALTQDIPAALAINEGDTINLTAAASGENLVIRWYIRDVGEIGGQNTGTVSVTATKEMNGKGIYCHFENSAGVAETSVCILTVNAAPTPTPAPQKPTITKNPTGETVKSGESASFIAKADNVKTYKWQLTNGSGSITYDYNKLGSTFPGLVVSGGDTEMLTLSRIPKELNGWKAFCVFANDGGEVASEKALIQVQQAGATLSIVSQPKSAILTVGENPGFALAVQASATDGGSFTYQWFSGTTNAATNMTAIAGAVNSSYCPEQKEGTMYYRVRVTLTNGGETDTLYSDTASVTFAAPKVHEHAFSDLWEHNDISHWHQCTCGEHGQEAFHTYEWTVIAQPTDTADGSQKGVCSVCGYETVQPIPAGTAVEGADTETAPARKNSRTGLLVGLIIAAVAVIGAAAYFIVRILKEDKTDDDEPDDNNSVNEKTDEKINDKDDD